MFCRGAALLALFASSSAGCLHCAGADAPAGKTPVPKTGDLTVEVRAGSGLYACRGLESVTVRFHNAGRDSVFVLKPLDGSDDDTYMPYYRFGVRDADGRTPAPCGGRCVAAGLWASTKWPDDYLVEIKPSAHFDIERPLYCDIVKAGRYKISFEYLYQPTNERFAPPPRALRGSINAAEVTLDLKKMKNPKTDSEKVTGHNLAVGIGVAVRHRLALLP
jgi:hypothetical protein